MWYNKTMKKIIICGLGAVGLTFAAKLDGKCRLKILVDEQRFMKLKKNKPKLNGKEYDFEYILPQDEFEPDLIIISTKLSGLDSAVSSIKNFVKRGTIIISLLNGISSEERIISAYPESKVLKSYFIGHSAVREGNSVTQDGVGKIVIERDDDIIKIFEETGIDYSVPEDIDYSLWLKFTMNIFSNQTSAILNMTFGELKQNKSFISFARKIIREVCLIAEKKGIKNPENLEKDALNALAGMCDEGRTSMHQDILAGRKTEVELFAGEILRLGKEFNVETPFNQVLYDMIKILEERNEHCIHSGKGRE